MVCHCMVDLYLELFIQYSCQYSGYVIKKKKEALLFQPNVAKQEDPAAEKHQIIVFKVTTTYRQPSLMLVPVFICSAKCYIMLHSRHIHV